MQRTYHELVTKNWKKIYFDDRILQSSKVNLTVTTLTDMSESSSTITSHHFRKKIQDDKRRKRETSSK